MANKVKIICPYCKSENVATILYGMPDLSNKELLEEIENGKTLLGGCCIDINLPLYHCNDCKKDWGIINENDSSHRY
jgi:DNA-directed RNA polymerase subunit RPC12/RpoP